MKALLGGRILFERASGSEVTGQVFRELDQKNFDDFEQRWQPMLDAGRLKISSAQEAAKYDLQDAHWEWVDKAVKARRIIGRDTFAVESAGETQGLMLTDVDFARLPVQRGREVVYVELLATAPWNRPKLVSAPWNRKKLAAAPSFKGVGRVLIGTAISLSVDLGFAGRIGLHSLPQSMGWYQSICEFTDLGLDASKNMHYFEMTEADAAAFVS